MPKWMERRPVTVSLTISVRPATDGRAMTETLSAADRVARPGGRRWRLWLCALALGLAMGFAGVPEGSLRYVKSMVRKHRVHAHEVVVAIDDQSLATIGQWPFPRSTYAKLIERLFAQGARRVFFTLSFSTRQSAAEDQALAHAIAAHPGRVFLAARFKVDPHTGRKTAVLPLADFARVARLSNINMPIGFFGDVTQLPYAISADRRRFEGMAAQLAEVGGRTDKLFPLDTSISRRSLPVASFVDVLRGTVPRDMIAGRDVVIGATADTLGDTVFIAPYGPMSSAETFVLGAETLHGPPPLDLGWLPAAIVAGLVGALALSLGRRVHAIALALLGVTALLVVPVLLPTHILVSVVPGLAMLVLMAGVEGQRHLREMFRARGTTNQVSGLLNLAALRQIALRPDERLVVARIHNFADVIATLPPEAEAGLVAQIAKRLKLGMTNAELYHGDNGVFAWFAREDTAVVGERLEGLHALFRSAVTADGSTVDLAVTFGVDGGSTRSVANRLGSALVAAAEAAAEGAKWREFDTAKLADAAWKLSLLSQLDAAIDEGDLWVAYQPKLDLATRRIIGAEALVRWTHPEKGAISPIEFVAAAEQNNRIEKLTRHVLQRAVLAAATINAHEIDFTIAVNLSTRLLETRDIIATVTDALAEHKLEPGRLTLEITETAALVGEHSLAVLNELRDIGVLISIDDYGTGLSTLEYLKKIPASEIKIDRSFVQAMLSGGSDLLMVNSTIQLAHSLGHRVVAEGVETDEVLARLADLGCDVAQGYRIGRPMTFQDLARRLLAERKQAA